MFISQQLLPLEPSGFLWHWNKLLTPPATKRSTSQNMLYPKRETPPPQKKTGTLESTVPCTSVTQEKRVRNACSISKSSRCSFTTNTIHVQSLYDWMSNQKIVLLLHFIRGNKSFNFDLIGSLTASMCCVSSSFICKKKRKKKKGSVSCNAAWNILSLWQFYKLTMTTDHAKCKWFALPLVLKCYFGFCLITTSTTFAIICPLIFCHNWSLKVEQ